jgi:gamma-butyrobetaine dioxygenase
MPATLDFDHYPRDHKISSAAIIERGVSVIWDDGIESQFHVYWLRGNAADALTCHPESKEQKIQLLELPEDLTATKVSVCTEGELQVNWSNGEYSSFDLGWLRAYCHRAAATTFALANRQHWSGENLGVLPRFDGPSVLTDRALFGQWYEALHSKGMAILENLPTDEAVTKQIPALIGPIRQSNFGYHFDVRTSTESTSNMPIPLWHYNCTRTCVRGNLCRDCNFHTASRTIVRVVTACSQMVFIWHSYYSSRPQNIIPPSAQCQWTFTIRQKTATISLVNH